MLNPFGNEVVLPAFRLDEMIRAGENVQDWQIVRGGTPEQMDRYQRGGFVVPKKDPDVTPIATPGPLGMPEPAKRTRKIIAHVWPCPLNIGGAQRFILDVAVSQSKYADVHVIYAGTGPGEWLEYLPRDHGINFYQCDRDKAAALLAELQPDLCWHHLPRSRWALESAVKHARYIVGTEHSWASNVSDSRPSWCIPIVGETGIRHGIDLTVYSPRETTHKGRGKARITVGVLGRRTAEKLPESFVRALERHDHDASKIDWHFVGNADATVETQRMSERLAKIPNVTVSDTLDPSLVADWLRSIDVLCVPSSTESVCYAAIEAMACGVPVVARHVDGLIETIGTVGMLRESDADLIAACEELAANKSLRTKLGKAGRERAVELFDVKRMYSQYAERVFAMTNGELYGAL